MKKIILTALILGGVITPIFSQSKKDKKKESKKTEIVSPPEEEKKVLETVPYYEETGGMALPPDGYFMGDGVGTMAGSNDGEYFDGKGATETLPLDLEGKYSIIKSNKNQYEERYTVVSKDGKTLIPNEIMKYYTLDNGNFLFVCQGTALLYSSKMELKQFINGNVEKSYNSPFFTTYVNNQSKVVDENFEDIFKNYKGDKSTLSQISGVFPLQDENRKKSGNLFTVSQYSENYESKVAIFDRLTNKFITPFCYSGASYFGANIIATLKRENNETFNKIELLDPQGKVIKKYTNTTFNNNRLIAKNESGKFGLISTDLTEILPFEFDEIILNYRDDSKVYIAKKGSDCFLFDELGSKIFSTPYQKISVMNDRFIVQQNGKYGLITLFEKNLVPFEYDSIFQNNRNYFLLKNKQWTIINSEGVSISSISFDGLEKLRGSLILKKGTKFAILSEYYENLDLKFEYDEVLQSNYDGTIVKIGTKYYILKTENGVMNKSLGYDEIFSTTVGSIYVVKNEGKFGILNKTSLYKACVYDLIIVIEDYENGNRAKGILNGKEEYISLPKNYY